MLYHNARVFYNERQSWLQVLGVGSVSGWERGELEVAMVTRACSDSGSGWMRTVGHAASSPASLHSSPANLTSKSLCFTSCVYI